MRRGLRSTLAALAGVLALGAVVLLLTSGDEQTSAPGAAAPDVAVSAWLDDRVETRGSVNGFIPVSYTHLTLPTTPYV